MSSGTLAKQASELARYTIMYAMGGLGVIAILSLVALVQAGAHIVSLVVALLTLVAGAAALSFWRRLDSSLRRSESEIDAAENRIRDLGLTDALTGVANRRALREYLAAALTRAEQSHTKVALLVLDLDRFKPINSEHGQVVGDLVLKEVARRIADILSKGEFCARAGGDEFAIVVEAATVDCLRRLAHRLVEALCAPMQVDGHELDLTASIGAAMFPTVAQNADDLLRKTDIALRRARQENRGAVRVYDLTMEVETTERLQLEADLRESIGAGALTPHFLPVIDLKTGAVASFEILARWRHPRHGEICPKQFLPIVESLGLINEMTINLLEAACRDARVLPESITLSLNVSPAQIQDQWLVEHLLQVLTKTGFPAQRLQVEVSENALVADLPAAKRVITALNNIGVRVALDNFGSGYSSLSYLAELSFDAIKIDPSFVRAAPDRPESAKIVAAIVSLSKSLGVIACAEGVETAAQADFLRGIGCSAAQGFFFARPMPPAKAAMALSVNLDDLRDASLSRASA
jgi:diguanylate cyclase (GGDEF)-like protein